jgi:hypothetical protein
VSIIRGSSRSAKLKGLDMTVVVAYFNTLSVYLPGKSVGNFDKCQSEKSVSQSSNGHHPNATSGVESVYDGW